ncbi:MAG: DUF4331 family protein [Planctomycetaceae bacterium]
MRTKFRLLSLIGALCLSTTATMAADHLDSPSVNSDGRLDINDLYVFQSPTNAANTVMIMTVNPLAGVLSPTTFNSRGIYEFHIDNNGDAISDLSFSFYFSTPRGSRPQSFIVLREDGSLLTSGRTGSTQAFGAGKVTAGKFDDPFFFDLDGFQNGFMFTGTDFFAGADVTAIVLEVPSASLNGPNVAVWARTVDGGSQFDRMGRPAINTVLINSNSKDAYNAADPRNDVASFSAQMQANIEGLNGGDSNTAQVLTSILLPDLLTVDVSNSAGFLNGRQLADDVIDAELNLLSNGGVTTDGVDMNDVPFAPGFPYLAAPHN